MSLVSSIPGRVLMYFISIFIEKGLHPVQKINDIEPKSWEMREFRAEVQ